jgi:hypothetical protein
LAAPIDQQKAFAEYLGRICGSQVSLGHSGKPAWGYRGLASGEPDSSGYFLARAPGHDYIDYVKGANIAAFVKVADAMLAYGVV